MPSFFEKLRRMAAGEPVFRPGETDDAGGGPDGPTIEYNDELYAQRQNSQSTLGDNPQTEPVTAGGKIIDERPREIPVVTVSSFECHEKPDRMEVNLYLNNSSQDNVWVERVELFGKNYNIEHELKPGEKREFMVYNGPYLNTKAYTNAAVDYKASDGNYLSARHTVEYQEDQQGSGRFVPFRFRFFPPVKDI